MGKTKDHLLKTSTFNPLWRIIERNVPVRNSW